MEELSRETVVTLALEANFGRHEVMKDIAKYERLTRLIQKQLKENEYGLERDTESN
jgi:transposase-like protein